MGYENQEFEIERGPSWARDNWPLNDTDDLTGALDPTQMQVAVKTAAKSAGKAVSDADAVAAADDAIRAQMLIRTYRVRGHLAANLDPLGLTKRELPADLTPEYHGLTDPAKKIYLGGTLGLQYATVAEIVSILRANYCGNVGLEYMHIADVEERRFLQDRLEGKDKEIIFTPEGMIGLYFGYWWMNMMTMKTCWICNRGLVKKDPDDPKNPPDGDCPG